MGFGNDVVVIGAGVVGCFIARALSRYNLNVRVLEAGSDVAEGASKANSAIVHAGFDAKPGTNKAKFNVWGNRLFEDVCHELKVPFDAKVVGIEKVTKGWQISCADGQTLTTKVVVNAAGIHSDELNNLVSATKYNIEARRGEYLMLDKDEDGTFSATIFQVPSKMGKGILVSPTVDGTVIIGPTAQDIPHKEDKATTYNGLEKVKAEARRIYPDLPLSKVITEFSGLRAHETTVGDFILGEAPDAPYFFNAVGAGPAGLAAAIAARESGATNVLVIERDDAPGGILQQCIHNGFGLHRFNEELTGPEYAQRFIDKALALEIPLVCGTMVLDIQKMANSEKTPLAVTAMSPRGGLRVYKTKAVVLAMGCRERPRGALMTPGTRPAGVYTAGTVQRLVNLDGIMPGKRVVILGSGDIGLIMARRLTFSGAKVLACIEIMKKSSGLMRNVVQCLNDYDIPLLLSHTVTDVEGCDHVTGVKVSQVDDQLKPIPGTEIHFDCDTLLLSCGLIPENELTKKAGAQIDPKTHGPKITPEMSTTLPGVFAAGNVVRVYDLVDWVSRDAEIAGRSAAAWAMGKMNA